MKRKPALLLLLLLLCRALPVCAAQAGEPAVGPLIQTITLQEEYEGRVACGGAKTAVLDEADVNKAYENVRPGIVQIFAGGSYGSGMIWKMEKEQLLLLSSGHLLSEWNAAGRIVFYGGAQAGGELLMLSDTCDLGFLRVKVSDMTYEELSALREVSREETGPKVESADPVINVGSADGVGQDVYEGTVASPRRYIEEFNAYMLYCHCDGKPGMSGGGTFDACGNLLGMLTGGTGKKETASIPVQVIQEEYEKLAAAAAFGNSR